MANRLPDRKQLQAESLLMQLGEVLGIRLRLHSDVAGDRWVSECAQAFGREHGHHNVQDISKKQLPYDLVVNGFRVQCKTRTPKRGRSMSIEKWWGQSRYGNNAFDVLALKYGTDIYIIPIKALVKPDGTFKNDIKPDNFWRFKNRWNLMHVTQTIESIFDLPLFSSFEEATDGR